MYFSIKNSIRLLSTLVLFLAFTQICVADDTWRPVTQEELALDKGKVEKDADAEAIFWEVKVADDLVARAGYQSVLEHYIRIKILTERGRENHSKVHIPFGRFSTDGARVEISNISARTTKPDGTQVLLDEKDIFEQEIVKGDGIKVKGKSFAVPGIDKGAIIEYRWKEVRRETFSFFVRLNLSRDIPVQKVKYFLRPISNPRFSLAMRIQTFAANPKLVKEEDGFYSMTAFNIRSFEEEPYMPPEFSTRPWLLIYYADEREDTNISEDKYWKKKAKETYEFHKSIFKKNKHIEIATTEAIADAIEPLEKVRRLYAYCKLNIKNVNDDALGLTPDQRKKIKVNRSEKDTLKRGLGTGHDINMLFASMVNSAGLEVRVANVSLRSNPEFKKNLLNDYFLNAETIAIKINDEWQFFDPSLQHHPFGLLSWAEEGQTALISDKNELIWKYIEKSKPEQSTQKRTINVKLDEQGTLTGDVTIEYTGHHAEYRKENFDEETEQEITKSIIKSIKERLSDTTEVTDLVVENIKDSEKPLVYKFKIRSPNYSEQTGKRIFLRPHIFAKNSKSIFKTSERKNSIFFNFAWSELDEVNIEIPDGYKLETLEKPKTVKDTRNIGLLKSTIGYDDLTRTLKFRSEFSFGNSGLLEFDAGSYDAIKKLFDSYNNKDQQAVTLLVN